MDGGKKECPDCRVEMVEGFHSRYWRTVGAALAGRPTRDINWTGVKAKGKECRLVATYRCVKCGLLRSYATMEVNPPSMWEFEVCWYFEQMRKPVIAGNWKMYKTARRRG